VDSVDPRCDASCADGDGDGYSDDACGGSDCDDSDPSIHPGGGEHCTDGFDNNCNGLADWDDGGDCPPSCGDLDGDGYVDRVCGGSDCNDTEAHAYPGSAEVCDGADNDCDGHADEGYPDQDGDDLADCVDEDDDGDGWHDAVSLSGGGCYCGGAGGGLWVLTAAVLLLPGRIRRRPGEGA
jgi:hypothetical protein